MNMIIRPERESDHEAITAVTEAAFANHPFSHQTEQFIVKALRAAGALAVSLVAEVDGRVVGHVAFSPVVVSDGSPGWYGLGPVSVLPKLQRQGIGTALVREGLSLLRARGARGCVLTGDPGFYQRFGFRNEPELVLDGIPQVFFLALVLNGPMARGQVTFHEGFSAKS
ncbi:MAG: N-acetyltransferase [Desulfobacteraceae bacterium]|nr:N-acetyltransferase [Desulfobacteraceae bacterium]